MNNMWPHPLTNNETLLKLKNAKIALRMKWEGIPDSESEEAKKVFAEYQQACYHYQYYLVNAETAPADKQGL